MFERAFEYNGRGVIAIHNHPSGSPLPSSQDVSSTRSLQALATPMDVSLIDHLIVGSHTVFSMRAAGLLS
jgi:DNA repair protein RadC